MPSARPHWAVRAASLQGLPPMGQPRLPAPRRGKNQPAHGRGSVASSPGLGSLRGKVRPQSRPLCLSFFFYRRAPVAVGGRNVPVLRTWGWDGFTQRSPLTALQEIKRHSPPRVETANSVAFSLTFPQLPRRGCPRRGREQEEVETEPPTRCREGRRELRSISWFPQTCPGTANPPLWMGSFWRVAQPTLPGWWQ